MTHPFHTQAELETLLAQRIAILDGAMGTLIQAEKLTEADFRGPRFAAHARDLKGNNDMLVLSKPELIQSLHARYFAAGADIVETNTFSGTSIAQADYGFEPHVRELNVAAAQCALKAARAAEAATPGRLCFVAGAIGPTNRTLSMSPDVNSPDFRAVSWEQLTQAYGEQAAALLEGGVDLLLVETIFDTLNAKAALFALEDVFARAGRRVPVLVSVTITDASGRTLSGQTISAFYDSIRHAKPFSVGINCALGAQEMRPYVEELSQLAECFLTCYPNAGLPNAFGGYDQTPSQMAAVLSDFARQGWLNVVGGCCGSTPEHIQAIARSVAELAPRQRPQHAPVMRLSGLESLVVPSKLQTPSKASFS